MQPLTPSVLRAEHGPLVDRAFRRRASTAGTAMIALFMAILLWVLVAAPSPMGAGSGDGSLGGSGGGSGGGHGAASGSGTIADAGAADASGGGIDATGVGASEGDGAVDAPTTADAPASRPPLRVGFSEAQEPAVPAAPVAPAPSASSGGRAGGADGGGGGTGDHSFMGVAGKGRKVVYVIDRSGSMGGDRIAHTRYELKRSIRALPADGEFFVIFFDQRALPMPAAGLAPATPGNKDRFSKWIDQQSAGGGTDPRDAMAQALALEPDTIYLMSDGVFDAGAADAIRAANRAECVVHTIAFHDRAGEALLARIARENGGIYRFVAPP